MARGNRRKRMTVPVEELAPGVFRLEIAAPIPVNVGLVVGDEGCALVDSGTTEANARAILAALGRITDQPLRYVINTHHHGDHSFGNFWCRPARLVGHRQCRARLVGDAGTAHRDLIARLVPMAAEKIRAVPVTPPDRLVETHLEISLGARTLAVRWWGRAHTDNDLTVAVAGGPVFAGDLIEEAGPPLVEDGYPLEWGSTLRALLAVMGETTYVPGHGRPVAAAFVAEQATAFEAVREAVLAVHAAGGRPRDALARLPQATRAVLGAETARAVERALAQLAPAR